MESTQRDFMFGGGLINQGYLPFTRGKPEIPVGKSNGSCHSIWEASDNMGCNMR